MSNEDYKQLEHLLDLLEVEVGDKISIIPRYVHDGYHMAVYSKVSGMKIKQATGPTIKDTVEILKHTPNGK